MSKLTMFEIFGPVIAGLLAIGALYFLWLTSQLEWSFVRSKPQALPSQRIIFLFKNGQLVDASIAANQILTQKNGMYRTWSDVHSLVSGRITNLPKTLQGSKTGLRHFPNQPIPLEPQAILQETYSTARLELINWDQSTLPHCQNPLSKTEWRALVRTACLSPVPIWQTNKQGQTVWKNHAYDSLLQRAVAHDVEGLTRVNTTDSLKVVKRNSVRLRNRKKSQLHFDVTTCSYLDSATHYATDVTAIVEAEQTKKHFVKTLGQTFAQISTGLAIFDKNKQLIMFNPALLDMFDLSAEFLVSKPSLRSFFDTLREERKIPEHRDFTSWRERLTNLILDASNGSFSENWQLPNGSTYNITGRPHPDGAIAFLIEDVTADLSISRQFKSEIEMGHAVLDQLIDGIAVISAQGHLQLTNAAFCKMLGIDPDASFAPFTVHDLCKVLSDFVQTQDQARLLDIARPSVDPIWEPVSLSVQNGMQYNLRLSPLPDNARLVILEEQDLRQMQRDIKIAHA